MKLVKLDWYFEPRDFWIGIYWNLNDEDWLESGKIAKRLLEVYVCIIPMLPIYFFFEIKQKANE